MKTREEIIDTLLVENQHFKILHDAHRELDKEIIDNFNTLSESELKDKKQRKLLLKEEMEEFIIEITKKEKNKEKKGR